MYAGETDQIPMLEPAPAAELGPLAGTAPPPINIPRRKYAISESRMRNRWMSLFLGYVYRLSPAEYRGGERRHRPPVGETATSTGKGRLAIQKSMTSCGDDSGLPLGIYR